MTSQKVYPHQIVSSAEKMFNQRLTESQFLELLQLIDNYREQVEDRCIELISEQQATSKQPVINQLPPKEQTSLDDLLPF